MTWLTFDRFTLFSKRLFLGLLLISLGMMLYAVINGEFLEVVQALRNACIFTLFFLLTANIKKIERWISSRGAD